MNINKESNNENMQRNIWKEKYESARVQRMSEPRAPSSICGIWELYVEWRDEKEIKRTRMGSRSDGRWRGEREIWKEIWKQIRKKKLKIRFADKWKKSYVFYKIKFGKLEIVKGMKMKIQKKNLKIK